MLIKSKSSIKPTPESQQNFLKLFVENYFNEKGPEKSKVLTLYDKISRKLLKNPDSDSLVEAIDNLLDPKARNLNPPKVSLIKQQETLIKKNIEDHPRQNLKPVTIIKEIITTSIIEDPVYEEYVKWKEVNKLEEMIEIIKKKGKFLENFDENQINNKKNMSKTMKNGFSNMITSNTNEITIENREKTEMKGNFDRTKPRLMTSDEVFRKNHKENKRTIKKFHRTEEEEPCSFDLNMLEQKEKDVLEVEEINFSKKKYFFKYPFKTIEHKYKPEKINKTDDMTEKFFENLYMKLVRQHEKCGPNCGHLKRFYQRIGFVNKYLQKEEVAMNKNVIDKMPYLNEISNLNSEY